MKNFPAVLLASLRPPGSSLRILLWAMVYVALWVGTWYSARLINNEQFVSLWFLPAGLRFFNLLVFGGYGVLLELAVQSVFALMQVMQVEGAPVPDLFSLEMFWRVYNLLASLIVNAAVILPLRHWLNESSVFTRPDKTVLFLLAALLVSAFSGLAGVFGLLHMGIIEPAQENAVLGKWLIGDFIGIITLTPLLLVRLAPRLRHFLQHGLEERRGLSGTGYGLTDYNSILVMVLSLILVFGIPWDLDFGENFPLVSLLLLLPLSYVAQRHGLRAAVLAVFLLDGGLALLIALFEKQGHALHYQLVMIAIALVGLWLGISVDRRKAAEAAQGESEQRFTATFERAAMGIGLVALDGRWLRANPKLCAIVGYSHEELISKTYQEITYPEDLGLDSALVRQLLAGEIQTCSLEKRYVRKDRTIIWINLTVSMMRRPDGSPDYFISIVEDIQRRKDDEAALKASEHALQEAQRMAGVGNWTWALGSERLTWSKEMYRIFDRDPSLPPIAYPEIQTHFVPESWERLVSAIKDSLVQDLSYTCEAEVLRLGGPNRWVNCSGEVTCDAKGKVIELHGTVQDITERRQIAQELDQYSQHLENVVRARTADLAAARDVAEAANNAKSRFLAAASHDLRQPLMALSLYVSLLKITRAPELPSLVGNIQNCVASLSELLTDLLDVSKLEAGVVVATPTDFSLDDLLASLVSVHAVEAELKGLCLRHRRCSAFTYTDQTLLGRILGNLLSNAIRYTEKGGVLLACRRRGGRQWVEVWDTGIGIPKDKTVLVFEEFRQLGDNSRTRGSGLGLAIVAKTAKLLGLEIRLQSKPGRGSMFAIEIPPGRSPSVQALAPLLATERALRIGVVDDNAETLRALVLSLESVGYTVCAGATGRELLSRLCDQAPDVIISDYRLTATENGFDVIEAVRRRFEAELPALLITGDTNSALIRSMADRGIAVHYKPLQFDELHQAVREATGVTRPHWAGR